MRNIISLMIVFLLAGTSAFTQTNYYIDAVSGNDANAGTSSAAAWKNLTKLYNLTLTAGSTINLKSGAVWNSQQLKFKGSGTAVSPIIVNSYGTGAKPVINGNGITGQGVVYLYNQQYIEINNLEITNTPNAVNNADFFVGVYNDTAAVNPNPLGADRRGVMVAIDNYGTANHIYLKNLNIHHIKGQLGSGSTSINGAIPKRTGGVYFAVLDTLETTSKKSRFNDVLVDSCNIYYCENIGLAFDNEWNVYYPGGQNSTLSADQTEYTNWYNRRFSSVIIRNNVLHHIGKNAMFIRCTDSTGLVEKNVCYETALGTTGNTYVTARAKGTIFQYNEGYYNRASTQTVDPGSIDGSMYDPDYGSVGIIFQYSYSHDNSEGLYWGCNTRSLTNTTTGIPDPGDIGCTVRYCVSQNDLGDLLFFNYPSAGNEIYNNVFYIKSGTSPNIIHENSGDNHTYNFRNNIIYNMSSATTGADFAFGSGTGIQTRNISNNIFFGNHHSTEPADPNKLITDPLFLSPGSGATGINTLNGYKLQINSPAINSGLLISDNGGKDYFGNAVSSSTVPNRGIYQGAAINTNAPTIISFSPTTATSGNTVIIKGKKFTGTTSVKFGGTSPISFSVTNDSTLSAILGSGSTGRILVTNASGSDSSSAIFNYCTRPSAPAASAVSVCSGRQATLIASGLGTIVWYTAASGGTRLGSGSSYTTPSLTASTTYYALDSTCSVSATRTAVPVTVIANSSSTTSVSRCSNQLPYVWNGNSYTAAGTYTVVLINAAGCDSIATLALTVKQTSTSITQVLRCSNQLPYVWNGNSYSTTGTYTYTTTNLAGCDSICYLYLTVNQTSTSTTPVTRCSNQLPYVWNGNSYTAAGAYTVNLTNAAGCDSLATLVLTVKQTSTSTTPVTRCSNQLPYVWNGNSYTATGTYTVNLTNAAGCDSITTLVLTVRQTSTSSTPVTRCSNQLPYVWNGNSYTAAGTYTVNLTNAAGCDSLATLVLTVKQTSTSSTPVTRCSNQLPYVWNGNSYTAAGTYTVNLSNAAGCDSVATLVLTIKQTSSSITQVSRCSNQLPYIWNGNSYTATGSYTVILTNAAGCDSTAVLYLQVKQTSTSTTSATTCSDQLPYVWNGNSYSATGSYTVILSNTQVCDSTTILNLTVISSPASYNVTGGGTYTSGGTGLPVGLSSSQTGVSYQLLLNNVAVSGAVVSGTGSAISFGNQTAAGVYTVRATPGTSTQCAKLMQGSATITIGVTQIQVFTVTGGGYYCSASSGVAIGLSSSQTGVNYQLLRSNGTISVGLPVAGTGSAISFGNQTTVDTYTVKAINASNGQFAFMANSVTVTVISSSTASGMPGVISGPSNVCIYIGQGTATYKISSTLNATSYLWSVTAGGTIIGSAVDTIVTIQYDNTFTSGSLSVVSKNACLNSTSTARTLSLTRTVPAAPTAIYGVTDICPYLGTAATSTPVRYYVNKVANATSYLWAVPAGATISSTGDSSIDVVFASTFVSGNITVTSVSPCGNSTTAKSLTVYKRVAATPAAIQKSFTPSVPAVTYVCGYDTQTYRIRLVTYATSYNWTMKNGSKATITHINPLGVNDTAVIVRFLSGYTVDTLQVQSVTACSVSAAKTVTLSKILAPPAVSAITSSSGNFAPCVGTSVTYTATASAPTSTQGIISYFTWTRPANTSVVSATADSSSITVSFNTGYTGGSISAKGVTACGIAGTVKSVSLQYSTPTPTSITSSTGSYNACIGTPVTYTVVVGAPSTTQVAATVYRWTKPNNTTITSAAADSSSITLQFNTGYTGGSLTVKGQTSCGVQGTAKSQTLTHTGCPAGTRMIASSTETENSVTAVVYPNPSSGIFILKLTSALHQTEKTVVDIFNSTGERVLRQSVMLSEGKATINLKDKGLKNGIYLMKYIIGGLSHSTTIVIDK